MQVEGGYVACGAVFVGGEGVDCIGETVGEGFGGLEGGVGEEGCVECGLGVCKVGWSVRLVIVRRKCICKGEGRSMSVRRYASAGRIDSERRRYWQEGGHRRLSSCSLN